jgi:uncharacterized damage-inducible protein DinB
MSDNFGKQLIDTWAISNRINLYLLDAIPSAALNDLSASKGRTVAEQFAHLHNVRLMWLGTSASELMEGLEKIEKDAAADKKLLQKSLKASGRAVEELLEKGIREGKIKGFKPHVAAFLGYLISHESHHRGQIALSLKQSGHPLDKKTSFGTWEWGVR